MGCDIHLFVERRTENGWELVDPIVPNKYYEPTDEQRTAGLPDDDGERPTTIDNNFCNDRNYRLFGMLANVRNGYEFAGVDLGGEVVPIDEPRGLPEDVTAPVKDESDRWGSDGHSHSHFTLRELLEYDWTRRIKQRGQVPWDSWVEFRRRRSTPWGGEDQPQDWCGDITGPSIIHTLEAEAVAVLDGIHEHMMKLEPRIYGQEWQNEFDRQAKLRFGDDLSRVYISAEWDVAYYTCVNGFLSSTMPRLFALTLPDCNYDDLRIVFWFDN
jgi:hypothetical protein